MRKNQVLGAVPFLLTGLLVASPDAWAQRGSTGGSRASSSIGSSGSRASSSQGSQGRGSVGGSRPSPAPSPSSSGSFSRPSSSPSHPSTPPPSYGGRSSSSSSAPVVRYAPPSQPSAPRESFDRGRSSFTAPAAGPAGRAEVPSPRSALPDGLSNRGTLGARSTGFETSAEWSRSNASPSVEPAPRRVPFPSLAPSSAQRGRTSGLRSSSEGGPSAARLREGGSRVQPYEPSVRTRTLDRASILERYGRPSVVPESSSGPSASRLGRSATGSEAGLELGRSRRSGAGEAVSAPRSGRASVLATPARSRASSLAGPARSRAPSLVARSRAPVIGAESALKSMRQLARENPARARAMLSAGSAISSATGASLSVGFGITSGCFWSPGWCGWIAPACNGWFFWWGYPHYGWFGWGSPAHCWSPWGWWWWGCSPWWYSWYYPVYYSPPVYYATVVHHYYDSGYSDGGYVTGYAEPPPAEGEGVAQAPAVPGQAGRASEEALVRAASEYLTLGDTAFREGRYADAVHFYAKAIEYQPQDGVLYLVLSDALFATGDYHYGAYALRRALELDPAQARKVVDKHGFYGDPTEFDRQLAVLETYLVDRPGDTDARLLLAANYLFGGRPAAAVDLLESPAGEAVRSSAAGALILASAKDLQYGPRPSGVRSF